jgi:hypothetical protein
MDLTIIPFLFWVPKNMAKNLIAASFLGFSPKTNYEIVRLFCLLFEIKFIEFNTLEKFVRDLITPLFLC